MSKSRMLTQVLFGLCLLGTLASTGCVRVLSQVMYMYTGGDLRPADFDGLAGKKVAVVCVSSASTYGQDITARSLAKAVGQILSKKVKGIKVVHQEEIANWMDNHDFADLDYREIGKGVSAEMVMVINLNSLSLYEGQTLYKGRVNASLKVLDVKPNEVVYERRLPEFTYPQNGAMARIDKSELDFRSELLLKLAQQIAQLFHEYEFQDDYARDSPALRF